MEIAERHWCGGCEPLPHCGLAGASDPFGWLQVQASWARQGRDLFPHRVLPWIFFPLPSSQLSSPSSAKDEHLVVSRILPPSPTSRQDCWVSSKGSCATSAPLEDIHPWVRVPLLPGHLRKAGIPDFFLRLKAPFWTVIITVFGEPRVLPAHLNPSVWIIVSVGAWKVLRGLRDWSPKSEEEWLATSESPKMSLQIHLKGKFSVWEGYQSSLSPSSWWTQVRERTGMLVSKEAAVSETFDQPSPQEVYPRASIAPRHRSMIIHAISFWPDRCLSSLFKVELLLWEKTGLNSFLTSGVNAFLFRWDPAFRLCCPSHHKENDSCFREEKRNIRFLVSWRRKGCKYWMEAGHPSSCMAGSSCWSVCKDRQHMWRDNTERETTQCLSQKSRSLTVKYTQ